MTAEMAVEDSVLDKAQKAADSQPIGWMARLGLSARAVVYLLMGLLTIAVAAGNRATVDQRGALSSLLSRPFGTVAVWVLAAGFAAYALWRILEAAFGVTGAPDGVIPRLKSLVRGLAYCLFAVGAVTLLSGAHQPQSKQQEHLAAQALTLPGGAVLLAAVGMAFVVAGALMVWEGFTAAFLDYFGYLPQPRRVAIWLGRIGSVARGVVFALAGSLVVWAAMTSDASKAGGINDVVHMGLDWPGGPLLIALMGVGLLTFGVYGVAEALWRRVPGEGHKRWL